MSNKCAECSNVQAEVNLRLQKMELGQDKLSSSLDEVKKRLQEAVANIDYRLKALEPRTSLPQNVVPGSGAYHLVNYPVPPGFHLSPDRPVRQEGREEVKYPFPPSLFPSNR